MTRYEIVGKRAGRRATQNNRKAEQVKQNEQGRQTK